MDRQDLQTRDIEASSNAKHSSFRYAILAVTYQYLPISHHKTLPKESHSLPINHKMLLLLLLPLLHATTTIAAPETRCLDQYHPTIATAASCDNALNNLQRFMLPYYRQETVKVGSSRTSDIQLRKHFIDDSPDHPPGTPRCGISFFWDPKYEKAAKPYPVSPDAYDVLYPSQLQSSAQRIRDQCVAGAPPR